VHTDTTITSQTLAFIEDQRGNLLLHAGAAALADGRCIVLAGPTGSGKTTLTAALARSGLGYVTDETVCLDPGTLAVTPFPKPLTVKTSGQHVLADLRPGAAFIDARSGNWHVDPATLPRSGSGELPSRLRPEVVVFPTFDAAASAVTATAVSPARAAFLLGEESSALWAVQPRPLAALQRLVRAAPAWGLTYSDAFDAARVVVDDLLLHGSSTTTTDLERVDNEPAAVPRATRGPARAEGVDWIGLDGEAVVFDGTHLHHLDASAGATWQLLDGTRPLDVVAQQLSERFAASPAQVLVDIEDLVRVLRSRGLVVLPPAA
jgi:energy-coupling factor transporter ATP-binding protein EcfA2